MKRLLLLFAILITLNAESQTSVYHPFPDSSAIWNFHSSQFLCSSFGTIDSYYSIMINGDTLINGQIYHNLWTPFVMNIINGNCTPWIVAGFQGAIRQDTAIRKVFYVPPSSNTEQLLYDFTMQVGDTVQGIIESWIPQKDTVESIDSVLIWSSYRKRWTINSCYNIYFIEGIGSTYGLFQLSPHCYFDLDDYALACFQQNGASIYPDTTTNCELITGVKDLPRPENMPWNIFPNPAIDELNISFPNYNGKCDLKIINTMGQTVLDGDYNLPTKIDIQQLESGIYIIKLATGTSEIYSRKFIKE